VGLGSAEERRGAIYTATRARGAVWEKCGEKPKMEGSDEVTLGVSCGRRRAGGEGGGRGGLSLSSARERRGEGAVVTATDQEEQGRAVLRSGPSVLSKFVQALLRPQFRSSLVNVQKACMDGVELFEKKNTSCAI